MLPSNFTKRFQQLMGVTLEELVPEAQQFFAQRSKEMAARGHLSPSQTPGLHHERTIWLLKRRINAAFDAIARLLQIHELPYSDSLAAELKDLLASWVTETWCKQMVDHYGILSQDQRIRFDEDLFRVRSSNLMKTNAEIDLLTDVIKKQAGKVKPKEESRAFVQARDFSFVKNADLRKILERDYQEIQRAFSGSCWKSVIILCGSAMEGILTDQLYQKEKEAQASQHAPRDKNTGTVREISEWGLVHLIRVTVELKLINLGIDKHSHSVREYRDLVHPSVEVRTGLKVNEEEAKIAMEILNMIIRDICDKT